VKFNTIAFRQLEWDWKEKVYNKIIQASQNKEYINIDLLSDKKIEILFDTFILPLYYKYVHILMRFSSSRGKLKKMEQKCKKHGLIYKKGVLISGKGRKGMKSTHYLIIEGL